MKLNKQTKRVKKKKQNKRKKQKTNKINIFILIVINKKKTYQLLYNLYHIDINCYIYSINFGVIDTSLYHFE